MRIDAYNAVSQVYQASKPKQVAKTNKTGKMDQVQISSFGRDLQIAKQAVKDAPDIREDVTAPLKQSIQSGTYNVSGEDFASKLLAKYQEKMEF
ncbi:MAG: flagellar biosynthesis anti-sigma factor FlgM [Lachnospiraceae bacterium]|nr:flagellar biosynthesis anti-sigma factor FlgM [Lachnospiraceae bacterium]